MKQANDKHTMELPMPGAKRGRGRPPTGTAMTNAERQAAFKARRKANPVRQTTIDTSPWSAHRAHLEQALRAADTRIKGLEKENALLIAERASAFQAAEATQHQLKMLEKGSNNTGELLNQVMDLEADNAKLEMDKGELIQKLFASEQLISELNEKLKKRTASRQK